MRYDGNVALMVIDASFTSLGLNYFTAVVPAVLKIKKAVSVLSSKQRKIEEAGMLLKTLLDICVK